MRWWCAVARRFPFPIHPSSLFHFSDDDDDDDERPDGLALSLIPPQVVVGFLDDERTLQHPVVRVATFLFAPARNPRQIVSLFPCIFLSS